MTSEKKYAEKADDLIKDLMEELVLMRQIIHNIEDRNFIYYLDEEAIPVKEIDYSIDFNKKTLVESYDRDELGKFESLSRRVKFLQEDYEAVFT